MSNWIPENTALHGDTVALLPLTAANFSELSQLAEEHKIWEFVPIDMSTADKRVSIFNIAITERESGNQYPFVVYHKRDKKIIGSTRLMNIEPRNRRLEIGFTWLHPDYWATDVNLECKLQLLTFCFEQLNTIRVQLRTDENNIRSRKAIAKIGGVYEGIVRHDMIRDNGTFRNSAYFSLIPEEWPANKIRLTALLEQKRKIINHEYSK